MLYLIGLGLNLKSLTVEGMEAIKKCKRVYLENYTVDFPYAENILFEKIGKKVLPADRDKVEGLSLLDEAKKMDVALLVYGSPLTATTHITLIDEARRDRVKCKVVYNASVLDAVAETGLQLYKFGKIASMPAWKKSFEPTSFMKIVQQNMSQEAHSLILIDIGLEFVDAMKQLKKSAEEFEIPLRNMVVCEALGTKGRKISYGSFEDFDGYSNVKKPYCIVIPSKMHFVEKEVLESKKIE